MIIKYNCTDISIKAQPCRFSVLTLVVDVFIDYEDPDCFIESKIQEFEFKNLLYPFLFHLN